jgi:hypothetical protein
MLYAAYGAHVGAESIDDPTRPFYLVNSHPAREPPGWTLNSVMLAPNYSVAIINGKMVRVGEHIDHAKVLSIAEDRVVLLAGGFPQVLPMFPSVEISAKERAKE